MNSFKDVQLLNILMTRNMWKYVLILFNLSCLADAIFSGSDVDENEFPFIVSLKMDYGDRKSSICGGTIISKNLVLTTVHCVKVPEETVSENCHVHWSVREQCRKKHSQIHSITATMGDSNMESNKTKVVAVDSVLIHPRYHKAIFQYIVRIGNFKKDFVLRYNDIALLRLKEDLDFTDDSIQPIGLPSQTYTYNVLLDTNVTRLMVAGWGKQLKLGKFKLSIVVVYKTILRVSTMLLR